jgi:hypothetical protein
LVALYALTALTALTALIALVALYDLVALFEAMVSGQEQQNSNKPQATSRKLQAEIRH